MTDTVRHEGWDGSPGVTCDWIKCDSVPVLVADLAAFDPAGKRLGYGGEAYLCAEHLDQLVEQARAVLVVNGVIEPATTLERNIVATVEEHLP